MNIVIADHNEVYMQRFIRYVNKNYKEHQIQALSSQEALAAYLAQEKCDVLLFSPTFYEENILFKNAKLNVVLLDEQHMAEYPSKFRRSINKYTRITEILKYIKLQYEEVERNQPMLCGVYAPAGGVGKTTIALSVALAQCQLGKKVLYLNLEELDSTGMYFASKPMIAIDELIATTQSSYERMINRLVQKDEKTGLMYFSRSQGVCDPYTVTVKEVKRMLDTIIENEIASTIVIDFGTGLSSLNFNLFKLLDKLIVVSNNTAQANYKLAQFLCMEEIEVQVKEKMRLVVNNSKEFNIQVDIPIIGRIDKLYATHPLGVSEYIAQNHMIVIEEKNKVQIG